MGNFNNSTPSGILGDTTTAVAAAGTTAATATIAPADHIEVTTATVNQGVILTEKSAPALKSVINSTTVAIKVYPWSGAAFNGQTANAAILLNPGGMAWFMCHSPTKIGYNT